MRASVELLVGPCGPARTPMTELLSVAVSVSMVSGFLGRKNGSPRPKNRDPRDLRTRDNGESTSVALREPAVLKSCATAA